MKKYTDYNSLPSGIQKCIAELHPHDYQKWVHELIPALNNRSIIDTINTDNGMVELYQYLKKIESYLGVAER
jgi:hypothetical protein